MKSFSQYLVETRQTFDYRIKILGDADAELINKLEEKLQQFDVVKMTEPKKTPIQKTLSDLSDNLTGLGGIFGLSVPKQNLPWTKERRAASIAADLALRGLENFKKAHGMLIFR